MLVFFAAVPVLTFLFFAGVALRATFFFTTFFLAAFRVIVFFRAVFFVERFFDLPAARAPFLAAFFLAVFCLVTFFLVAFFRVGFFVALFFVLIAVRVRFLAAFLATFLPAEGRRVDALAAARLRDGFAAVLFWVFLTAFFAAIVRASMQISRNGRLYIRLGSEEAFG